MFDTGARVLDLASGAGSQTLDAARRVGAQGHVMASDISDTMLHHVRENARAAGLANVTTLVGAAEDLDLPVESFDAATVGLASCSSSTLRGHLRQCVARCDPEQR